MTRLRVVLAGELVGTGDHGGATWAMLQWVLGLRALGCDVMVVEPTCEPSTVRRAFASVVAAHALQGRAALVAGQRAHGMRYAELADFAASADVLINLSGRLRDDELFAAPACRVYVDLDPAFTQVWHAGGADVGLFDHDVYVTVAARLDDLPRCGCRWHPIRPPVMIDHWSFTTDPAVFGWTTVANLRSYGSPMWRGQRLGQKVHSLRTIADLPLRAMQPLSIALRADAGDEPDVALLDRGGWRLLDPDWCAGTPDLYFAFVRSSLGEIGVAKEGYIASRCGWISERTACYLASGRPALVHDTGLNGVLPTGDGLLTFTTSDDAAAAVEEITANYEHHRLAARALAVQYFDAALVLREVLDLAAVAA